MSMQFMDAKEVEPQVDEPVLEPLVALRLSVGQEMQRCTLMNDRILEMTTESQEIKDMIESLRAEIPQWAIALPPPELVTVNPEPQGEPILIRRISDEEGALMGDLVRRFGAYVNTELIKQMGLYQVEIDGSRGKFAYVPLVFDNQTMRLAFMTAMAMKFIESETKRKVLTLPTP